MALWKLTLAYNGTTFHGWQIQPDLPTIQGTLARALHRITGETVLPQGSGRTDAGVHALAQVSSFPLLAAIPAPNLQRALNRILPASIRVLSAATVDPPFHARHSARSKTYEYRIFLRHPPLSINSSPAAPIPAPEHICSPMLAPFVWDCPLPLDLNRLHRAATHIVGLHDFTSFAAAGPHPTSRQPPNPLPDYPLTPPTNCRTITHSLWTTTSPDLLTYRITGSGFLHHMVRNLVGTFVEAGAGRLDPDHIPAILAAQNRSAAGPTAPAQGLFLVEVTY